MATAIEIINAIRSNQDEIYQARVPLATRTNLTQVGDAITSTKNIMNDFMSALIDKVAFSNIMSKMYKNPLAILKGTQVPYGSIIEDLFVNPATDIGYQSDGTFLLKTTTPDGKSAYYGLNRKSMYPLSINQAQLQHAFTSEQEFMSFYNSIVASLYSGDNIDEFMLMKNMLGGMVEKGKMVIANADISTAANCKELAKAISNTSKYFTFNNTAYAGYNKENATAIEGGTLTAAQTFCPVEDQCLILRADVQTEINFEVLATMFHMELAQLEAMTLLVDDIPSTTYDIYAMLVDRKAIQVRDNVYKVESEYIKSNLTWNVWLHHWQFMYLSMFGNAVAFGKAK